MSQHKYAGRHRPASSSAGFAVPAPSPDVPAATAAADANAFREVRPATGRHRAPSTSCVPRLGGSGLLLPTAAAATLVLTATGAHFGQAPVNLAPTTAQVPAQAQVQGAAGRTERQEIQDLKASALAATARDTQQRAGRDAQRRQRDAVAREDARRRADEQARAAASAQAASLARAAAAAKAASNHAWVPFLTSRYNLTSGFGMRWGSLHPGQDFAVPVGTPVMAMSGGTVVFAGWSGGYGNKVEIRYWDGTISWMAHNSALKVTQGESVTPGEVVALSGNTGHSTGPHSHLEIHLGGDETDSGAIPPIPWLKAKGIMPLPVRPAGR